MIAKHAVKKGKRNGMTLCVHLWQYYGVECFNQGTFAEKDNEYKKSYRE